MLTIYEPGERALAEEQAEEGDCPAIIQDEYGISFYCTLDVGHPMPHVADGHDFVCAEWDENRETD